MICGHLFDRTCNQLLVIMVVLQPKLLLIKNHTRRPQECDKVINVKKFFEVP